MQNFPITLDGFVCADIGASTGGFTDCMLQNGATKVYAIDVGYGQLAWKLRSDERVINLERTNFRYVTENEIPEKLDFASVEVSFISLKLILPVLKNIIKDDGCAVCLIKPQFEAGKERVGKKGVVREPEIHREVLEAFVENAHAAGMNVHNITFSPIKGPEGNIEYLMHISKESNKQMKISDYIINDIVEKSHSVLSGD